MARRKGKRRGAEVPPPLAQSQPSPAADRRETAFPANPQTPGQAQSRAAYEEFRKDENPGKECDWWDDYLTLRGEGWDWRKAAYIAWASSPALMRWPATQRELATEILGLKSDRVIRLWREKDSKLDERVAKMQIEPLMRHRRDVIDALVVVACIPSPKAHQDRALFLEMTGDYKPRGATAVALGGQANVGIDLTGVTDDQLDKLLANLEAAASRSADREEPPGEQPK